MNKPSKSKHNGVTPGWSVQISLIITVAALGYFVDIYDLVLFSVIRVKCLQGIGIRDASEITQKGLILLNLQMAGMLVGGFIWGVVGDKFGRLRVLFGSIILYSTANVLNGFAESFFSFSVLRFAAGLGLAGELGAGITLVAEVMSAPSRGLGTMIVAGVGLLGAVVASLIGDSFSWQTSFFVGGGLGFALLLLRLGVSESGLFQSSPKGASRGSLRLLFGTLPRIKKYICCFAIALPLWFLVGILITLGPEFGKALHIKGAVSAGKGILYTYLGIACGDLATGLLSQALKSRKKVIGLFLILTLVGFVIYLNAYEYSLKAYYYICYYLGVSTGFWVLFVTVSAEQFGTNLRATVTTSVPNVVRGSVILFSFLFNWLKPWVGILPGALIIGTGAILTSLVALTQLEETFGKDLNYLEVNHEPV